MGVGAVVVVPVVGAVLVVPPPVVVVVVVVVPVVGAVLVVPPPVVVVVVVVVPVVGAVLVVPPPVVVVVVVVVGAVLSVVATPVIGTRLVIYSRYCLLKSSRERAFNNQCWESPWAQNASLDSLAPVRGASTLDKSPQRISSRVLSRPSGKAEKQSIRPTANVCNGQISEAGNTDARQSCAR
jgi:hypothetical protein